MQVRTWYVRAIREFLPKGDCLLGRNWNKGDLIEIRLRVSKSQSNRFLPFEEILGTLLHELVHIVYGPHRAPFKRLLAEITHECENALMRKLILPSFDACGEVLGGDLNALRFFSQRDLVRFAAESRMALSISTNADVYEINDDPEEVIVLE